MANLPHRTQKLEHDIYGGSKEGRSVYVAANDTKQELLKHLDFITRRLDFSNLAPFTTTNIASEVNISRNLASQYLNDIVHEGTIIKINSRPVLFMHKRSVERHLQAPLDRGEYASIDELMLSAGIVRRKDFDGIIGCDLSLSTCIEQLKSAICYPPHGLPVLLIGELGTGKGMLSRTMFEYGISIGALPANSRYVAVDCSRYGDDDARFRHDFLDAKSLAGHLAEAAGGIVYLAKFDQLPRSSRDRVLEYLCGGPTDDKLSGMQGIASTRIVLATSLPLDDPVTRQIIHRVPIVAAVPALRNRTVEERTDLVMHFLRLEGRRVAADVAISRGALRALVEANFEDNVEGLRSCVTNCCAGAYLNRQEEQLVIRSYNLPAAVLGSSTVEEDDDKLVSGDKRISSGSTSRTGRHFQAVLDAFRSYNEGRAGFDEFFSSASASIREYQDYLNFESRAINPRLAAFEQVLTPIFEEASTFYGVEFSRKSCHALAQSICTQLWSDAGVSRWRTENAREIKEMLLTLMRHSHTATAIVGQLTSEVSNALGVTLDALSQTLLFIDMKEAADATSIGRERVGIILAHGYSTATSIADAANRILHRRVFEAIDMAYDQRFSDVAGQLSRLLERFAHASTVTVLVDMGSLAEVDKVIHGISNGDLYVVNNVSTGLAIEIGSALISNDDLEGVLNRSAELLTPSYRVIRGTCGRDVIVFCSENGSDAADRIRQLVASSLPDTMDIRLVTTDFPDLVHKGDEAPVFGSYRVRAIMGTMDPGVSGVPFIGLEDILMNGSSEALDRVLVHALGPSGIAQFHTDLLKNVTLRSVTESITILDTERLFSEAEKALSRLQDLLGEYIEQRKVIGVYVHLCGLIERLVTKNFIETHPHGDSFAKEHADFVLWFRESFHDLAQRYRVDIPVSEIAYVYDFMFGNQTPKVAADFLGMEGSDLIDE